MKQARNDISEEEGMKQHLDENKGLNSGLTSPSETNTARGLN